MSFLSRLKSKIEEQREELQELSHKSRTSIYEPRKDSRPQTVIPNNKRKAQKVKAIESENDLLELNKELEREQERCRELRDAIHSRQERYVKREQEYRTTIIDFEEKLNEGVAPKDPRILDTTSKNLERISQYHGQIIDKISTVQKKTMTLLKEQEVQIVKEFNEKLGDKCKELEVERKKDSEKGELNLKENKLYEELETNKSKIDAIDERNKRLTQKNNELKITFKSHDQDKRILEGQIESLRESNQKLKRSLDLLRSTPSRPASSTMVRGKSARVKSAVSRSSNNEMSNQYQVVISKLKRMIELEQKNTRAARTAYARELEAKKELESLLRACVDDVKSHISKKRSEQRMHLSEKSVDDMEKVIEILLSQERVLTLLYDKTFPPRSVMKEPFFNGCESGSLVGLPEDLDGPETFEFGEFD
jgi:hypothetical protein